MTALSELVAEKVKGKSNIRVASLHANAADDARALLDRIAKGLRSSGNDLHGRSARWWGRILVPALWDWLLWLTRLIEMIHAYKIILLDKI